MSHGDGSSARDWSWLFPGDDIAEFARDLRVVLATTGGLQKTTTLTALLPEPFLPRNVSSWAATIMSLPLRGFSSVNMSPATTERIHRLPVA